MAKVAECYLSQIISAVKRAVDEFHENPDLNFAVLGFWYDVPRVESGNVLIGLKNEGYDVNISHPVGQSSDRIEIKVELKK